jgi:tight adherence protein C
MSTGLLLATGLMASLTVFLALAARPTARDRFERYAGVPHGRAWGAAPDLTPWKHVFVEALVPRLERFLPGTYLNGLRKRLRRAGLYGTAHFQVFLTVQASMALLGALGGLAIGGAQAPAMAAAGAAIGVLAPLVLVGQMAARRQQAIYATLPDTIDLLTACVEAGLGLDAAIGHMTRRRSRACWALNQEFGRYQQELHMGVPRQDAMRNLANRCEVEDLRHLVNALAQGDALGVGISQVLRGQSQHLRLRRKQRAEEKAMKAPIKILFPLLIGVFPSLFVVILGPAALRLIDTFATR